MMPEDRILYVSVVNRSDADFQDMYDGEPVTIEKGGGAVNLRPEQAAHMFGWSPGATSEQMFKHFQKRQGWNTKEYMVRENGKTVAEKLFAKFEIKTIAYKMVEDKPDLDAPIPADPLPPLPEAPPSRANPYLRDQGAQ